ncbi:MULTISPECIES: hypothetical protein [Prochlorococcus]|uniref:hypothetical protein n=1 Tax=Prochlorococcus TaxID=1218 RepID=UPI0005338D14|nr:MULTISPECIES: hypothetical protein [Prochlorococcus]KGG13714.1 putative Protein phosphatasee 2A regulatory B [Prochlorococcus sp. MIT 0601]
MTKPEKTLIQAKVFEFAFNELVRSKRSTFQPEWTIDSWAKFLIWVALNCGLSGDRENLEFFAESLGAALTTRMRKKFFERTLESLSVHLVADPAESQILLMSIKDPKELTPEKALQVLGKVGLSERALLDMTKWVIDEGLIAIPWKSSETGS